MLQPKLTLLHFDDFLVTLHISDVLRLSQKDLKIYKQIKDSYVVCEAILKDIINILTKILGHRHSSLRIYTCMYPTNNVGDILKMHLIVHNMIRYYIT